MSVAYQKRKEKLQAGASSNGNPESFSEGEVIPLLSSMRTGIVFQLQSCLYYSFDMPKNFRMLSVVALFKPKRKVEYMKLRACACACVCLWLCRHAN